MSSINDIIVEIKQSDIYENPKNWLNRGLNPSDENIIKILRSATNDFLDKLNVIFKCGDSNELKLQKINEIVDELPWFDLDTEEKEFLADVVAPAIEATGNNPWEII